MNRLKKLFVKDTNYPLPAITAKQAALVAGLDQWLASSCTASTTDTFLVVKTAKIPMFFQHYTVTMLLEHLRAHLSITDMAYIPRSIALIVDADGAWVFYVGVRGTQPGVDSVTAELFLDALNRTNSARSQN